MILMQVKLSVSSVNLPPTLDTTLVVKQYVQLGTTFNYLINFSDPENAPVSLTVVGALPSAYPCSYNSID